jgi:hypothetical protein
VISTRDAHAADSPSWKKACLSIHNLQAFPAGRLDRRKRHDGCVEQHMTIAALLGQVQAHAASAQSLESTERSNRVFDRSAIVFEAVSDNNSHSNLLPALGAKRAREILEHNRFLASSKFDSAPHYYGKLFQLGTRFATGARAWL